MTEILEGQRFWKHGDHRHVWVVESVVRSADGSRHALVLADEHGRAHEEVELDRLSDRALYTPVPEDPHRVVVEE